DLSERRFSQFEILLREAGVLVADDADGFAGFPAGRPGINFAGAGEAATDEPGGPAGGERACRDLPQLVAALDHACERMDRVAECPSTDAAARGVADGDAPGNAARIAALIRSQRTHTVADAVYAS